MHTSVTRARARIRGVAAVSVALLLGATGLAGGPPAGAAPAVPASPAAAPGDDPFYTPPSPLTGNPGDVIRNRASTFTLDPITRSPAPGITAKQVLYRSTSATGAANAVSGTVLVPTAPWTGRGSRPVVAYAPGTRGVGDVCAPSYVMTRGTDYEGFFVAGLLSRGWAVAVTDYEGLGTPGEHTYVVGRAEGHAVLDIARAAQRLPGTGLSASSPVGLMGYSQGGGATGWAAQLEPSYAPELDVRGVVAGGVPGDLTAVADFVDGGPFVIFELLAGIGLDAAYPELDLGSYLNERGQALMEDKDSACLVNVDELDDLLLTLVGTLFSGIEDYTTSNPLDTPAWQARLAENKLGAVKPQAPVYMYHGIVDEIVPLQQAAQLRRTWCTRGANVTWSLRPGEHALTLVEGYTSAANWLDARFDGHRAWSNCWLP
jgi:hypothetical protein